MPQLTDIPEEQVPSVVEEALRDGVNKITITKQNDGKYTVSWE